MTSNDFTDESNRYAVEIFTRAGWTPWMAWRDFDQAKAQARRFVIMGTLVRVLDMTEGGRIVPLEDDQ